MFCEWTDLKKGSSCIACGHRLRRTYDTRPVRMCGQAKQGIGDKLEAWFTERGITKENYIEFKKQHGLPPTCNCDARKEWLNELGNTFGNKVRLAWEAFTRPKKACWQCGRETTEACPCGMGQCPEHPHPHYA